MKTMSLSDSLCSDISSDSPLLNIEAGELVEKAFECAHKNENDVVLALLDEYGKVAEIESESDVANLYAISMFKAGRISQALLIYEGLYRKLDNHVPVAYTDDFGVRVYKVSLEASLAIDARLGYARTLISLNRLPEAEQILARSEDVEPTAEAKLMLLTISASKADDCRSLKDLMSVYESISNIDLHTPEQDLDRNVAIKSLSKASSELDCDL